MPDQNSAIYMVNTEHGKSARCREDAAVYSGPVPGMFVPVGEPGKAVVYHLMSESGRLSLSASVDGQTFYVNGEDCDLPDAVMAIEVARGNTADYELTTFAAIFAAKYPSPAHDGP